VAPVGELMAIEVRTGAPADAEAVVALWSVAAGPSRLVSDVGAVTALLDRDPSALLVAVDEGAVVGTVIVGWDGWRCHLYRMAVAASHRRRGVGVALVDAALERARGLGARRLDAMVADENELGQAFWAARGFERDDHDSRWTRPS
jgi:ribosomal protein S18 acetylase RimI-like enzyme